MESGRALLVCGTILLSTSALIGFVQHRYRDRPDLFSRWRVVHVGGTAGGVQLVALSAVWQRIAWGGHWSGPLAGALIFATWAFFFGPLASALGWNRAANRINKVGAVAALIAYPALPVMLFR